MSITAAKLQAEVGADTRGFDSGMAHADRTIKAAPGKWATALKVGAGAGLALAGAFVVRGIAGAIRGGLASLTEQGVVIAQTNAAIRSTKGAANVSAGAIRDLSTALEAKSGFDDKAIQSGANLLLTFTNIRNESGKGNDIFNQSTEVLTNMARAMGTDVKGGAIQLGKALNDPLKGITALTRVGVTFDATQKKQIANFMKAGKVADAQKIILAELNKEFGKSNEEFMGTDAGKALLFQDAIEGVQQKLTGALLPALTRVRGALTRTLTDPNTLTQVGALGDAIAAIFSEGNLKMAAGLMTTAAGAIGTAIKLFGSLPPELQALAVGALAIKKITGIGPLDIVKGAGGLIKMVFERGATPANPLFVADVAGGLGKGALPGAVTAAGFTAVSAAAVVGILGSAAVVSWLSSQKYAEENTRLAEKGLTPEEIQAKKLSEMSPADRARAEKSTAILPSNRTRAGQAANVASGKAQLQGGRGDAGTAARVKEQSERAGVWERAVAAGLKPTAASVERTLILNRERNAAIQEKIRAAVVSADQRETQNSATLRSAVTSTASRSASLLGTVASRTTAIANKNFSPRITVPVSVSMPISIRAINTAVTVRRSYTSVRGGTSVPD